jgi:hypothetical protein
MAKRIINNKIAVTESEDALSMDKGGIGGNTVEEAVFNLSVVQQKEINQPNGVAGLDLNGKIPVSILPSGLGFKEDVPLTGPVDVHVNDTVTYTIGMFSSFDEYVVSASAGSVSRTGDTITYVAPATPATVTLTVNDTEVTVNVVPVTAYVGTPSITSPVVGATNLGPDVVLTGSVFVANGGSDTHASSDWQVATDVAFTNIVASVVDSTSDKITWTATNLLENTTHYARVRYKGVTMGYSNWSSARSFSTKVEYGFSGTEVKKLSGLSSNTKFGYSIDINAAGDTVIVGAPYESINAGAARVYKLTNGVWTQSGNTINGGSGGDYCGYCVSINATGDIIAVSSYTANSGKGYVRIFKYTSGSWAVEGVRIDGETNTDQFGLSLSLNDSGDTIIIGTYAANTQTGYVKVYKNVAGTWTLQGAKITGEATGDRLGISVDINGTGDTIIVGGYKGNGDGYFKVYKLITGIWTLQGARLTGEVTSEGFGRSVGINDIGDTIVVGAYGANSLTGYVKVYKNISGTWTLQGDKITGEAANDYFGWSVAINSTGDTIVVGAPYANGNTGYIKIYN